MHNILVGSLTNQLQETNYVSYNVISTKFYRLLVIYNHCIVSLCHEAPESFPAAQSDL